jgi:hypothetical protein
MKEKGRGVAEQQHSDRALALASRVTSVGKTESPRASPPLLPVSLINQRSKNVVLLQFHDEPQMPTDHMVRKTTSRGA